MRLPEAAPAAIQPDAPFHQVHGTANQRLKPHLDPKDLIGTFIAWFSYAAFSGGVAGTRPRGWFMLWDLAMAVPACHTACIFLRSDTICHGTIYTAPVEADGSLLAGVALVNKKHETTMILEAAALGQAPWETHQAFWAMAP